MSDGVLILMAIMGWFILFVLTSTISDKLQARREKKVLEKYEKEFD